MRWICPGPRYIMPSLAELPVKGSSELPALLTPPRHTQRRPAAAACKPTPAFAAAAGQTAHPDVLEVLFTEEDIHQATLKLGRCGAVSCRPSGEAMQRVCSSCGVVRRHGRRVRHQSCFAMAVCCVQPPPGDAPQPSMLAAAHCLCMA